MLSRVVRSHTVAPTGRSWSPSCYEREIISWVYTGGMWTGRWEQGGGRREEEGRRMGRDENVWDGMNGRGDISSTDRKEENKKKKKK